MIRGNVTMKSKKYLLSSLEIMYFGLTFLQFRIHGWCQCSFLIIITENSFLGPSVVDLKKTVMKQHTDGRGKWLKEFPNKHCIALINPRVLCVPGICCRKRNDSEYMSFSYGWTNSKSSSPLTNFISNSKHGIFSFNYTPLALDISRVDGKPEITHFIYGIVCFFFRNINDCSKSFHEKFIFQRLLLYQVTTPFVATEMIRQSKMNTWCLLPAGKLK